MKMWNRFLWFAVAVGIVVVPFSLSAQHNGSSSKYYDELISNMTRQVQMLQDENADLKSKVSRVEQKLANAQKENARLREEMSELRKMVQESAAVRDEQFRKISSQLEKLAKMPMQAPPPPPPKSVKMPPVQPVTEQFEEYVVQAGATLGTIARAYGVKVDAIKKANKLKGDNIYVGKKLLIPVK